MLILKDKDLNVVIRTYQSIQDAHEIFSYAQSYLSHCENPQRELELTEGKKVILRFSLSFQLAKRSPKMEKMDLASI